MLDTPSFTADIIDFAAARKKYRPRAKNRFAVELEEVACQIRLGHYDPEAMLIAFAVKEAGVTQYPYADINMTSAMATALMGHLRKRLLEMDKK